MSDEWVMVPREASEAMIRAGYSAPTVFGVRDMANTYRAMLAAAPDAPQRNREADRARYIDRAFNEWLDDSVADGCPTVWDLVSDVHSAWAAWTAHPHYAAPAAPQQAEPVAWMAFGGALVHAVTRNAMDPIEAERFDVPLYLHPPAAEVQQAEPVGDFQRSAPGKIWMNLGNDGMDEIEYPTWDALVRADENITWSEDRIDATDIPYVRADLAHPPAAEVQRLRDALTAICAVADDREEGNYDTVPIHFIRSIARDATKGGK